MMVYEYRNLEQAMAGPVIGITESSEESTALYAQAIERAGGQPLLINVNVPLDAEAALDGVQGLLLTGGADVHPSFYGKAIDPAAGVRPHPTRDAVEMPLVREALRRNLPLLGICRGFQALNVAMGGTLVQDLPGHAALPDKNAPEPAAKPATLKHEIFIPPGARMTAILGVGGFMKVNSIHHQGLRWAQKAPSLLASAYSLLKDGIIEAVESPDHAWVIGVQFHPERRDEVPTVFDRLFISFVGAAGPRSPAH